MHKTYSTVQSNKLIKFLGNNFKTVPKMDIKNAIKDFLIMSSIVGFFVHLFGQI